MTDHQLRIPARMTSHLSGSSAAAHEATAGQHRIAVWDAIEAARTYKDGSCTVRLTDAEVFALQGDAELLGIGARDTLRGCSEWCEDRQDALGDLRAARAVLRACAAALGTRPLTV